MWILHPEIGALSVVLADDLESGGTDPDHLMVRARDRRHLELLQARFEPVAGAPIHESPQADYRFRIIVAKDTWATVLADLVRQTDYRNMKGRAHQREREVGRGFVEALHDIWGRLRQMR